MQIDDILYSVRESADLMGCSKQNIRNRFQEKGISHVLVKNRIRYYNSEQIKIISDIRKYGKTKDMVFEIDLNQQKPNRVIEVYDIYESKINQ